MFRIFISIAVVSAALVAVGIAQAGRGVKPAEPAGTYMKEIVTQKLASEYDLVWQSLYPSHQQVASVEAYVGCESLVPSAGTLLGIRVVRTFNESIRVAGERGKLKTRAVRVRLSVASPLFPLFPIRITQTFHAVAVDGEWKWILSPYQYSYYRSGDCPYS